MRKPIVRNQTLYRVASKMPPLRHSIPGRPFDIQESEVVRWLIRQPEIQQVVFSLITIVHAIAYDPDTGLWCGVERREADREGGAQRRLGRAIPKDLPPVAATRSPEQGGSRP